MKRVGLVFSLLAILAFSLILASTTGEAQLPADVGIIRIRSDGNVEGTEKIQRNGEVHTLTGNLESSVGSDEAFIFVEKDNIVFDGAGHTVQGTGRGTAIYMLRKQSVTIKNFNIIGFETGINFWTVRNWSSDSKFWGLPPASKNQILNNNITVEGTVFSAATMEAGWAIFLQEAYETLILGNTIKSQDPRGGIYFGFKTGRTSLQINDFVGCGLHITSSDQSTASGNMVDGKPLVFLDGESNQVIDNAGLVYLFNCEDMTIRNIESAVDYGKTIQLTGTTKTEITNCKGYITLANSDRNDISGNFPRGIQLSASSYNKISANIIIAPGVCISLFGSSNHNEIYENILLNSDITEETAMLSYSGKNAVGISLGDGCQYNKIYGNNILNQSVAIECYSSSLNNFNSNNIANSSYGIVFSSASQNNVFQNNIEHCKYAARIIGSDNAFYNNNFVENEQQVSISHQTLFSSDIIMAYSTNNTFDAGYPLGGNYWSDYGGDDANGDGIGDTPYTVFENHTDRYPLVRPVALDIPPPVLDATPPLILIVSPENKTYPTGEVQLNFTLSKQVSSMSYLLDGETRVEISGNTTLAGLSYGTHSLTVYAVDAAGNTGVSETVFFTIEELELFPAAAVAVASGASVAIASVGLLVYFTKFKKRGKKAWNKV
jgi:nitrous oxidase accessory protein NosD